MEYYYLRGGSQQIHLRRRDADYTLCFYPKDNLIKVAEIDLLDKAFVSVRLCPICVKAQNGDYSST